ncbi:diamine acetyltransferase 2-like [Arapaima gigas]
MAKRSHTLFRSWFLGPEERSRKPTFGDSGAPLVCSAPCSFHQKNYQPDADTWRGQESRDTCSNPRSVTREGPDVTVDARKKVVALFSRWWFRPDSHRRCPQSAVCERPHRRQSGCKMEFTIRVATLEDCRDMARMITELAEYEKVTDQVKLTQRDLEQDGFSKNPFFQAIIAEVPEQHRSKEGHCKVGYALYFFAYSSWKGRCVYMEDLYVMPEFQSKGIRKALMSKIAQLGLAAGCKQLNFAVLNWNKPSIDFYLSQGCWDVTSDLGYHCMRCEGSALESLASGEPKN